MCECIGKVNSLLAKRNTALVTTFTDPIVVLIETFKVDEKMRGKPTAVVASHCPFCGAKYPTTPSNEEAA